MLTESELQGWKKSKSHRYICNSGRVMYVRRPSPGLVLKIGKIHRLLNKLSSLEGKTPEEAGWAFLDALSEEEADKLAHQAVELIVDIADEPRIYREPQGDQLGVIDLGNDFWPLYFYGMTLLRDAPVELENGETTVEAVETFPDGPATEAISSDDGDQVQGPPC